MRDLVQMLIATISKMRVLPPRSHKTLGTVAWVLHSKTPAPQLPLPQCEDQEICFSEFANLQRQKSQGCGIPTVFTCWRELLVPTLGARDRRGSHQKASLGVMGNMPLNAGPAQSLT